MAVTAIKRRVLAVDPGSRKMGYGLVDFTEKDFFHVESGVFNYSNIKNYFDRLSMIYEDILKIVEKYEPSEVALEGLIYVKSPTALIKLAQARGAMIASFASGFREKIFEYSPNLVKRVVTGYGHMGKTGVGDTIQALLGMKHFAADDESDALAIAMCHILSGNFFKGRVRINTLERRI